jgi:hypothetical protein
VHIGERNDDLDVPDGGRVQRRSTGHAGVPIWKHRQLGQPATDCDRSCEQNDRSREEEADARAAVGESAEELQEGQEEAAARGLRKARPQEVRREAGEEEQESSAQGGEEVTSERPRSSLRRSLVLGTLMVAMLCALTSASAAHAAGSWWRLSSVAAPTNLPPGGKGTVVGSVTNLGGEDAKASAEHPIKLTDTIPAGLEIESVLGFPGHARNPSKALPCKVEGQAVTCESAARVAPYEGIEIVATVKVDATSGTLTNVVSVEGGEDATGSIATPAPLSSPLKVSSTPTQFGVQGYELTPENEDGSRDTQAGSHTYQLTTSLDLNQTLEVNANSKRNEGSAPALVRDLHFVLPPGLLGNVTVLPRCSGVDFATITEGAINLCPASTAVGVAKVTINEPNIFGGVVTETVPVWNLEPAPGEPARFGIELDKVPIVLNTAVRTGSDYAVEVSVRNASQAVGVLSTQVSFWGAPSDKSHNGARGWECVGDENYASAAGKKCPHTGEENGKAFLALPTTCESAPATTVSGRSWPHGALNNEVSTLPAENATYTFPSALQGCESLDFTPTLAIETSAHEASTPTGLAVKIDVPQESTLLASDGPAEGTVKGTVLPLPIGVQASPGAANGLLTCSAGQIGFNGFEIGLPESAQVENDHFTPDGIECPDAAKIGTVSIKTPDLENELTGGAYLASQDTNPFGSPLVLYLFAEDPVSGVKVKLAGNIAIDQTTGQLTSTFENTPPVPFTDLTVNLFGGGSASQSTPPFCGEYKTDATFEPWSKPPVPGSASFSITSGSGGGPCPSNPQPLGGAVQASFVNPQAGAFSPFSLTIAHADSDQALTGIEAHLPPGAAAMISSVTPCPEPPAGQEWSCGADSLIGKATASSGFGPTPFSLPGQAYLTTGYDGAPFGLLVSTNAEHAGPFNLGIINVRSRINVDRTTAAVTVTTDPGPRGEVLPTMIKGVPVDLKQINVTVDRPNFEFNPTNCSPLSVTTRVSGAQGGAASIPTPIAVTNCAALPFTPKLTASTQGNASKLNGAALKVRIEALPGQANIAKTKLVLPITLPSRLTTIQKACPDTIFEANPAACDEGSNIGSATVHTPVLKSPLTGPAYLVSHGNAAFPDVEFVLQGEGITLILDGQTDIKKGITTSTFNSVPDAPVSVFETTLPEGPHSALTSNVPESKHFSLCGANLTMPTTITGQNGAVIEQNTKIPVAGCSAVLGFKLTRSQQLTKALKACRKQFKHSKKKRTACEAKARKKYGVKHKAKKKSKKAKKKK